MLSRVPEWWLEKKICRDKIPRCIAIVVPEELTGGWGKASQLIEWCEALGIRDLILYAKERPSDLEEMSVELADAPADITVSNLGNEEMRLGRGGPVKLVISLGYGGRQEVTEVIRELLEEVEAGKVNPEQIDEDMMESKLRFKQQPDLMIRIGGRQLSDFMIWQSSYSELYFFEGSWNELDKLHFLRAIRSYHQRERRFGR